MASIQKKLKFSENIDKEIFEASSLSRQYRKLG